MKPTYTVQRCRNSKVETKVYDNVSGNYVNLYGLIHYTGDCNVTSCGKDMCKKSCDWWILTADREGVATCPKCLKMFKR